MPASGLSGSRAGYLNLNVNLNPVGPTLFLTVAKWVYQSGQRRSDH